MSLHPRERQTAFGLCCTCSVGVSSLLLCLPLEQEWGSLLVIGRISSLLSPKQFYLGSLQPTEAFWEYQLPVILIPSDNGSHSFLFWEEGVTSAGIIDLEGRYSPAPVNLLFRLHWQSSGVTIRLSCLLHHIGWIWTLEVETSGWIPASNLRAVWP